MATPASRFRGGILSGGAREGFDRDGYVAFPGFLSPIELAELRSNLDRLLREVVPTMPREHVFFEDKDDPSSLKQLQQLGAHDEWFRKFFKAGPPREVAEVLLE
ncbi:MAG: phytanoyl-CoA dioxygenase family protein, partial [Planctomycetota bacterium]